MTVALVFQSAPLLRGAIVTVELRTPLAKVSIRAPLARGDLLRFVPLRVAIGFNPRPSCEGRCPVNTSYCDLMEFQSAPLLRGAIGRSNQAHDVLQFQSAPLLRGAI